MCNKTIKRSLNTKMQINDNMTAIRIVRDAADIMEAIEYDDIDCIKKGIDKLKLNIEILETIVKYFELTGGYN